MLQKCLSLMLCKKKEKRKSNHCQREHESQRFRVARYFVASPRGAESTVLMCTQSSFLSAASWEIQTMVHFNLQRVPVSVPTSPREGTGRRSTDLGWSCIHWVKSFTSTFISWYKSSHRMGKATQWDHRPWGTRRPKLRATEWSPGAGVWHRQDQNPGIRIYQSLLGGLNHTLGAFPQVCLASGGSCR